MSPTDRRLQEQLLALRLHQILAQYEAQATLAAKDNWTHVDYLARLLDGECAARDQRALERRLPWGLRVSSLRRRRTRRSRSHRRFTQQIGTRRPSGA